MGKFLSLVLNGILGLLLLQWFLLAWAIAFSLHGIISGVARLTGFTEETGFLLTPGDIIFNRVELTDIDFFNFQSTTGAPSIIRNIIAQWYVILMGIAVILLLFVLVYIAIKVLLSTAQEKAKHKQALTDWVVSVGKLFFLQIYAVLIIRLNNFIISIIGANVTDSVADIFKFDSLSDAIFTPIVNWLALLIIYGMFIRYTISFLILYVKRMIKVAFLIVIAPLITVTYAVDKFADKEAQALSTWIKKFTAEVLIQPFHAIIYLILLKMAVALNVEGSGGIVAGIISVLMLKFIFDAEGIIKQIFSIKPSIGVKDGDKVTNALVNHTLFKKASKKIMNMSAYDPKTKVSRFDKFGNREYGSTGAQVEDDVIDVRDKTELLPTVSSGQYQNNEEDALRDPTISSDTEKIENISGDEIDENETDQMPIVNTSGRPIQPPDKKEISKLTKSSGLAKKAVGSYYRNALPFAFATVGTGWEAADPKDDILKNMMQGGVSGYLAGKGFTNAIKRPLDRGKNRRMQKQMYSANVKIASEEMGKNAALHMALNGVEYDSTTKEGQKVLLEWMDKVGKADSGSLAQSFEANRERLISMYRERDGLSEISAMSKVDDLQDEILALGTDININEYNADEKDYISSMLMLKARSEQEEVESLTSEIDDKVMDVVKANVLNSFEKGDENYIKPEEIEVRSDMSTVDMKTGKLEEPYVQQLRIKDKKTNKAYINYEETKKEYEQKFNKTQEELELAYKKAGSDIEEFKKEHDELLKKLKMADKEIKDIYKTDYGLNPKAIKIDDNVNTDEAIKFIDNKIGTTGPNNNNQKNTDNKNDNENFGNADDKDTTNRNPDEGQEPKNPDNPEE